MKRHDSNLNKSGRRLTTIIVYAIGSMCVRHDSYRDPNLPLADVPPSSLVSPLLSIGSKLVGGGHTAVQGIASHLELFDLCVPPD